MSTPVSLSIATAVLLGDGWHDLASGSLGQVDDPVFVDPVSGELITPGDTWYQFTDTSGQSFACPARAVLGIKLNAPV